jgi:hypothetical protein
MTLPLLSAHKESDEVVILERRLDEFSGYFCIPPLAGQLSVMVGFMAKGKVRLN